jgi:predicted nucleic acid-binding protein
VIAVDTSSFIAFLRGDEGEDVEQVDRALEEGQAVLPPVVLTEILSDPKLAKEVRNLIEQLPILETRAGFWQRAGTTRAKVLSRRLRARLADTLISQSCIDHGIYLISRDSDFRHFEQHAGLHLM